MVKWGIIGCGDVTEIKSGPAFNKVDHSSLVAVMRRDAAKAKDYAQRHHVPKWYSDASSIINDPDVNAVYIATPPSSHEEYTIAALKAGKPVYVEKPMALSAAAGRRMLDAAQQKNSKLAVAHYRREQPLFKKIKEIISSEEIGDIRFVSLKCCKRSLTKEELAIPKNAWRVDPNIAGGGLFHDLAPHQLDLLYYFFAQEEDPIQATGISLNQQGLYAADDIVSGNILFKNNILFSGLWCFNVSPFEEEDIIEIVGSRGKLTFSVFNEPSYTITIDGKKEKVIFQPLQHVQQPMIKKVVAYFLDKGSNPCSGEDGVRVMEMMEAFVSLKG